MLFIKDTCLRLNEYSKTITFSLLIFIIINYYYESDLCSCLCNKNCSSNVKIVLITRNVM